MTETALSRRTFVIASAAAVGVVVGLRCAALAPAEMGERTYTSLITEAQVESAVHYGLTAAMYGEIGIQSGRAAQRNFHDYEMLRMGAPPVETHIVPGMGPLGGAGEVATPPAAPALTNAIFAATGKRIRTLPLRNAGLV